MSEGETAAGHEAWIVKFAATNNPPYIGPIEAAYVARALAAGLDMAPPGCRLPEQAPGNSRPADSTGRVPASVCTWSH